MFAAGMSGRPGLSRLDERRELRERHPPAGLVVGGRYATGQSIMRGKEFGSASASVIVIVISPRSAGSVVSNSSTSTTCSFGTSFTKRPRYVSVCAVVLPVPVGTS